MDLVLWLLSYVCIFFQKLDETLVYFLYMLAFCWYLMQNSCFLLLKFCLPFFLVCVILVVY